MFVIGVFAKYKRAGAEDAKEYMKCLGDESLTAATIEYAKISGFEILRS